MPPWGLRLIKMAALANLVEAATNVIGAVIGYKLAGLPGVVLGGCLGVLAMLPPARNLAALCGEPFSGAFVRPLASLAASMESLPSPKPGRP